MRKLIETKTQRLQLRQWRTDDRDPFAAMSSDPEVMAFFPSTLNRSASDALVDRCQSLITERGWGVWAVEHLATQEFMGMVGLHKPAFKLSVSPCIEILWRFARPYWGHGYATEAANAVLQVGFEHLGLSEIVAFTVVNNFRSRAVMERLNMSHSGETFLHPELPGNSPLKERCLYRISQDTWRQASTLTTKL